MTACSCEFLESKQLGEKKKSQRGKGSSLSIAALRQQSPHSGERQWPSYRKTSIQNLCLSEARRQRTPQSLISNEALVLQQYKTHSTARSESHENTLSQVQCFAWACFSVNLSHRALCTKNSACYTSQWWDEHRWQNFCLRAHLLFTGFAECRELQKSCPAEAQNVSETGRRRVTTFFSKAHVALSSSRDAHLVADRNRPVLSLPA